MIILDIIAAIFVAVMAIVIANLILEYIKGKRNGTRTR